MNSKYKSIIFFTRYDKQSASVRYRYIQYFNDLKKNDINVELSYLFDKNFFKKKILLNKINFFLILISYIKRFFKIISINKKTIIIIHLELFPYLPSIGETLLSFKKNRVIIDLDDAIFHQYRDLNNKFLKFFLSDKFKKIFNLKNIIIFSGNKYNKKEVLKMNPNIKTEIFPTVVNINDYTKRTKTNKNKDFTIVWIGSPSTSIYLKVIFKALKILNQEYEIRLRFIGSGHIELEGLQFESYMWNEQTEIELISECHVGIMPLRNDDWSMGKCGFKLIQYMACKIPSVASPVGVNQEIIEHGINGFLAKKNSDWIQYILKLKNNQQLYKKFSESAFNKISKNYSFESQRKRFISTIKNIN
jgi:glycosyltransferase involved in cell wall biosynthesis